MSNKPILYMNILSPPCRAVLLAGAELDVDFDWKILDMMNGDHTKPEYIEKNPSHTIPLLDDNGVIIADSHAICAYLVEKFGKTDQLYPKDLVKRALVDSRLHFDSGHLFARMRFLYEPILYFVSAEMLEDRIDYSQRNWDILERFLQDSLYICGDELTIADFCLAATAESLTENAPLDPAKHSKVVEWLERMDQLSYYDELNASPGKELQAAVRGLVKSRLEKEQPI